MGSVLPGGKAYIVLGSPLNIWGYFIHTRFGKGASWLHLLIILG